MLEFHDIPVQYDAQYPVEIVDYRYRPEIVPVEKDRCFFERAVGIKGDNLIYHDIL